MTETNEEHEFATMTIERHIEQGLARCSATDAALAELREAYVDLTIDGVDDREGFDAVHSARMHVKGLRVAVDQTRKELKADALRYTQAIDGEARRLTAALREIEDPLQAVESEVAAERKRLKAQAEAEKLARLAQRIASLEKLGAMGGGYTPALVMAWDEETFAEALVKAEEAFAEREAARLEAEEQRRREGEQRRAQEAEERAELERKLAAEEAKRAEERAAHEAKLAEERRHREVAEERAAEIERAQQLEREREARTEALKPKARVVWELAARVEETDVPGDLPEEWARGISTALAVAGQRIRDVVRGGAA